MHLGSENLLYGVFSFMNAEMAYFPIGSVVADTGFVVSQGSESCVY